MVDDAIGSNSWGYIEGLRIASAGTIPQDQQDVLIKIDEWLKTNGEAIYGTRPWAKFVESGAPVWHFTTKDGTLYAIASAWPGPEALIASVRGKIDQVTLLGNPVPFDFTQDTPKKKTSAIS